MKLLSTLLFTLILTQIVKAETPPQIPQYYMDGNGYIMPYHSYTPTSSKPQRYEDWTYTDENGLDYTVIIKIDRNPRD